MNVSHETTDRPDIDGRCIEGGDVRKSVLSNRTPTVDAYIRVTLGKHKKAPSKKTKVRREEKRRTVGVVRRKCGEEVS